MIVVWIFDIWFAASFWRVAFIEFMYFGRAIALSNPIIPTQMSSSARVNPLLPTDSLLAKFALNHLCDLLQESTIDGIGLGLGSLGFCSDINSCALSSPVILFALACCARISKNLISWLKFLLPCGSNTD
jgi:hypothetical protein